MIEGQHLVPYHKTKETFGAEWGSIERRSKDAKLTGDRVNGEGLLTSGTD